MSRNIIKGREGENRAGAFLEGKGYQILSRNYRHGRAEIDLILKKGNVLVFVEVKLRTGQKYGLPEEAVNEKKVDLIVGAAENYIFEIDWKGEIRFDIISLRGENELFHFEDAFS